MSVTQHIVATPSQTNPPVVQISDADSQYVRRSDCDTLFIVANYQPDKKDPSVAVNDEHALMRFEFLEAIVRLAVAKYGKVLLHLQMHYNNASAMLLVVWQNTVHLLVDVPKHISAATQFSARHDLACQPQMTLSH
jgi:hypothetical protein